MAYSRLDTRRRPASPAETLRTRRAAGETQSATHRAHRLDLSQTIGSMDLWIYGSITIGILYSYYH